MKSLKVIPIGAAIFALGLGFSLAPSPARAGDEDLGTKVRQRVIQNVQENQESGRDSDQVSSSGYLGVQVQRLTASLRRAKGIPGSTEGALVNNVEDQSPADEGGIKRGDVILAVNREPTPNPNDLVRIVRGLDPGKKVPVLIWRNGATRTMNLTVGSRPEGDDMMVPGMPGMEGPGNMRDMPEVRGPGDGTRMQILHRGSDDLERQLRDIHEMLARLRDVDLARLEREIRELRSELRRGGSLERRGPDGNNDRDRDKGDREQDKNEGQND